MAIRKRNYLTLVEFAEKVGASKSSVSDWEKGFRLPPEDFLTKIAIMGNTSVDKLLMEMEIIITRLKKYINDLLNFLRRIY